MSSPRRRCVGSTSAHARETVRVVAGIILSPYGESVLLGRRRPGSHQAGCWEFPGGKIEPNESVEEALARELAEELGIEPCDSEPYDTVTHDYAEKTVRIEFRLVRHYRGEPERGLEGQLIGWFPIRHLGHLTFPEANRGVVERLLVASPCSRGDEAN